MLLWLSFGGELVISLLRRFSSFRLGPALLHPEKHNVADQVKRQGMIQGKLHRSFGAFVLRKGCFEGGNAGGRRVKADVVFKGRKVNQVAAVQGKVGMAYLTVSAAPGAASRTVCRICCSSPWMSSGKPAMYSSTVRGCVVFMAFGWFGSGYSVNYRYAYFGNAPSCRRSERSKARRSQPS
jgi:hypothetical protein